MPKEKVIYRFRYEDPYHRRKKFSYLDRGLELLKEIRFANNLRSYQVMERCTVLDMLTLEELIGSRFPQRIRGDQQDTLGPMICDYLAQMKRSRD